jgi:hypothetical protein
MEEFKFVILTLLISIFVTATIDIFVVFGGLHWTH